MEPEGASRAAKLVSILPAEWPGPIPYWEKNTRSWQEPTAAWDAQRRRRRRGRGIFGRGVASQKTGGTSRPSTHVHRRSTQHGAAPTIWPASVRWVDAPPTLRHSPQRHGGRRAGEGAQWVSSLRSSVLPAIPVAAASRAAVRESRTMGPESRSACGTYRESSAERECTRQRGVARWLFAYQLRQSIGCD